MSRHEIRWDRIHYRYPSGSMPWELGKPRKSLLELVGTERIKPCKTLDLCCGAGTNLLYLVKQGFDVTAIDISDGAVKLGKKRAHQENLEINLLVGSFLAVSFEDKMFDFVFDMVCFNHVEMQNKTSFIHRVLKPKGTYFLTCFSSKNGTAWDYFTRRQIIKLFVDSFSIEWIRHISSLESDNVMRYFYQALMEKGK